MHSVFWNLTEHRHFFENRPNLNKAVLGPISSCSAVRGKTVTQASFPGEYVFSLLFRLERFPQNLSLSFSILRGDAQILYVEMNCLLPFNFTCKVHESVINPMKIRVAGCAILALPHKYWLLWAAKISCNVNNPVICTTSEWVMCNVVLTRNALSPPCAAERMLGFQQVVVTCTVEGRGLSAPWFSRVTPLLNKEPPPERNRQKFLGQIHFFRQRN